MTDTTTTFDEPITVRGRLSWEGTLGRPVEVDGKHVRAIEVISFDRRARLLTAVTGEVIDLDWVWLCDQKPLFAA